MKRIILALISAGMLLMLSFSVFAAGPDDILGTWNTEDNKGKVETFKCADKYCGRIVWLEEPDYPAGSNEGTPGTPKIDVHNPDPALRSRPVLGLPFMTDFAYAGDNSYAGGRLYDPEKGKTYSAKITLVSRNQLDLRGYIGISLFGRTSKWTR